jgi:hypothetical protein
MTSKLSYEWPLVQPAARLVSDVVARLEVQLGSQLDFGGCTKPKSRDFAILLFLL